MTSLTLDENTSRYQIRAFKIGQIQINNDIYKRSIIVAPQQLITDWPPQSFGELTHEDIAQAAALKPDILLIGTGSKLQFPKLELYGDFINQRIGIEIMDTSAACRTYNALTSEGRNVVAALILS